MMKTITPEDIDRILAEAFAAVFRRHCRERKS